MEWQCVKRFAFFCQKAPLDSKDARGVDGKLRPLHAMGREEDVGSEMSKRETQTREADGTDMDLIAKHLKRRCKG
jgi:hypothetical protein